MTFAKEERDPKLIERDSVNKKGYLQFNNNPISRLLTLNAEKEKYEQSKPMRKFLFKGLRQWLATQPNSIPYDRTIVDRILPLLPFVPKYKQKIDTGANPAGIVAQLLEERGVNVDDWQAYRPSKKDNLHPVDILAKPYTTRDFTDDLKRCINALSGGTINSYVRIATHVLQKREGEVKEKRGLKFPIHNDLLSEWREKIESYFIGRDLSEVRKCFEKYCDSNYGANFARTLVLKDNPNLLIKYFKNLDTSEKNYFYGLLLADGSLCQVRGRGYRVRISLHQKDHILVRRFAQALGFEAGKNVAYRHGKQVDKQTREVKMKPYVSLEFMCLELASHLLSHGFIVGKKSDKIRWPRPRGLKGDYTDFDLSLLLGFFDGDGTVGVTTPTTPTISSKSRMFLEDVRHIFGIPNKIRFDLKKDEDGNLIKVYRLGIGKSIYEKMMEVSDFSLPRKSVKFNTLVPFRPYLGDNDHLPI